MRKALLIVLATLTVAAALVALPSPGGVREYGWTWDEDGAAAHIAGAHEGGSI